MVKCGGFPLPVLTHWLFFARCVIMGHSFQRVRIVSIKVHDIPNSEYKLEVEYTQMIFRFLLDGHVAQVYHISGGPVGTCCIKDQHGTACTFNVADHRALDYALSLHNFETAQHNRRLSSGEFLTKEIKIRGVD